jgi:hypothetical protein
VSCTVVHPGGVNTNIVRCARMDAAAAMGRDPVAGFEKIARTSPDDAAAAILRAVQKDRRRVVIGRDGKAIDLVSRLPAGLYHWPMIVGGRLGNRAAARRARKG